MGVHVETGVRIAASLAVVLGCGCGATVPRADEATDDGVTDDRRDFEIRVRRALVLPLAAGRRCWDGGCEAAPGSVLAGMNEALATAPEPTDAAFAAAVAEIERMPVTGAEPPSPPDIKVVVDCGAGGAFETEAVSDALVAVFEGATGRLRLSENDDCTVRVLDEDAEGVAEIVGETSVALLRAARDGGGAIVLRRDRSPLGDVIRLEIDVAEAAEAPMTAGRYRVEVVKASIAETRKNGEPWDSGDPPDARASLSLDGGRTFFLQTGVVEDTREPKWGAAATVALDEGSRIFVRVEEKDLLGHETIGECETGPLGGEAIDRQGLLILRDCGRVEAIGLRIRAE